MKSQPGKKRGVSKRICRDMAHQRKLTCTGLTILQGFLQRKKCDLALAHCNQPGSYAELLDRNISLHVVGMLNLLSFIARSTAKAN